MRNTNKKGFTIVELVIVVAVIAILAAVLIPTFSGIIKKAQLSADKKAVQELNTYIAMEEADTFAKAISALEKHKVNTDNLAPISAGYSFVWNPETNQFALVETKEDTVDINETMKNVEVTVSTADYLALAVANGSKNIKLDADITYAKRSLTVESGNNVTLDLNGHTITLPEYNNSKVDRHDYVETAGKLTLVGGVVEARGVQALEGGELIINGTKIVALDNDGGAAVYAWPNSKVTIENGEIVIAKNGGTEADGSSHNGAAGVINNGGDVTIKGGTFVSTHETVPYLIINQNNGTMTIEGGTFASNSGLIAASKGKITIKGGSFTWNHLKDTTDDQYMFYVTGQLVLDGGTYVENNERGTKAIGGKNGTFTNNTSTEID